MNTSRFLHDRRASEHASPLSPAETALAGQRGYRPHLRAASVGACSVFCSLAKRPARLTGGSQMSESKSSSLARSLITGCCSATPTPYEQQPPSLNSTFPFIAKGSLMAMAGHAGTCQRQQCRGAASFDRLRDTRGRSVLAPHILDVLIRCAYSDGEPELTARSATIAATDAACVRRFREGDAM
jgi:hypothetical protein